MIVKLEGQVLAVRSMKTKTGDAFQEVDVLQVGSGRRSIVVRVRAVAARKIVVDGKSSVLDVVVEEREFNGRRFTTYDLLEA